jgi:hypothetical protein
MMMKFFLTHGFDKKMVAEMTRHRCITLVSYHENLLHAAVCSFVESYSLRHILLRNSFDSIYPADDLGCVVW